MRLYKKIVFIKEYVHNNQNYIYNLNSSGYTIENYVNVATDLITDDLNWKMEIFGNRNLIIKDCFTQNQDQELSTKYILEQYAEFLIYMHSKIIKYNILDDYELRNMHNRIYDLNSQRNLYNYRKKFYLA